MLWYDDKPSSSNSLVPRLLLSSFGLTFLTPAMWSLTGWFEMLAAQGKWEQLMQLGLYDDRVYSVVARHPAWDEIIHSSLLGEAAPSAVALTFVANGMAYRSVQERVVPHVEELSNRLCHLTAPEDVHCAAALSRIVGNCGAPLARDPGLALAAAPAFDALLASTSIFAGRAAVRLLAYLCSDPEAFGPHAVTALHRASGVMEGANRISVHSRDFVSRRFAICCLTLMGGMGGDRRLVMRTETTTEIVTRIVPEFCIYAGCCFPYAFARFLVGGRRQAAAAEAAAVQGLGPAALRLLRWRGTAAQRAALSSAVCGAIGVMSHSGLEFALSRRRAALALEPDGAERVSRVARVAYAGTAAVLACTCLRLQSVEFPRWMGDVCWRAPFLPRFFPAVVGLPSASPRLIPFVVAPFLAVSAALWDMSRAGPYDILRPSLPKRTTKHSISCPSCTLRTRTAVQNELLTMASSVVRLLRSKVRVKVEVSVPPSFSLSLSFLLPRTSNQQRIGIAVDYFHLPFLFHARSMTAPPVPKIPPARHAAYDPTKSYYPMQPAGIALVSNKLMEYGDVVKDARVGLLSSEDLCKTIDADLQSEEAKNAPLLASRFIKATGKELAERNAARDAAHAQWVREESQKTRPSTGSSQSSASTIYTATSNNPYTLGIPGKGNPYAIQPGGAPPPPQAQPYAPPGQYQPYTTPGYSQAPYGMQYNGMGIAKIYISKYIQISLKYASWLTTNTAPGGSPHSIFHSLSFHTQTLKHTFSLFLSSFLSMPSPHCPVPAICCSLPHPVHGCPSDMPRRGPTGSPSSTESVPASMVAAIPSLQAIHDGFGPLLGLFYSGANAAQAGYPVSLESLLRPPAALSSSAVLADSDGPGWAGVARCRAWLEAAEAEEAAQMALTQAECDDRDELLAEWEQEVARLEASRADLRRRIVPPEVQRELRFLEAEETRLREALGAGRDAFCAWVWSTVPQWVAAARQREAERAARDAAMEAARRVLEQELLQQTASAGVLSPPLAVPPVVSAPSDADGYQSMRRQAIEMLAQEEVSVKTRRMTQLQRLKDEEDRIRSELNAREEAKRRGERQQQYQSAIESEAAIRARIEERDRLTQIRREERAILIEHLKAEEEILRHRLKGYEERRQAEAEAARQREAMEKQRTADRLRIEEELLRQRLETHQRIKMAEVAAAAQARAYQEEEARRQWAIQQAEAAEAAALERSREALRQRELEYERRQMQRRTQMPPMPLYPPLPQAPPGPPGTHPIERRYRLLRATESSLTTDGFIHTNTPHTPVVLSRRTFRVVALIMSARICTRNKQGPSSSYQPMCSALLFPVPREERISAVGHPSTA
eukprot:gene8674-6097_t